ncbi:ECF transporter S component [uncultured Gemmiger sp.]|uniref:ECF transporter S component n=1 Tax=uncultured Gemmiger sp. TaxID=1623490 RepID=UPI0025CEDBD8|nr:ECF transporter S component [uncultured Gemmiger sp.]
MKTNAWKLKDVLLIAICAVLFGVVYLGCTYVGGILYGILTPFGMASLGYEPFYGIYFMAGAFGVYVMRKPGAGLIAELLAAVLECLFGNYFGPIIILSGLVQGFGFELIVALKRYKKFDRLTMIEGAVLCSVLTLGYNLVISGYNQIAVPVLALMLAVRIVSAIVFDGVVTPLLVDGLVKAGLLKGYAVARDTAVDLED